MTESPVQITTPDGICDALAYIPDSGSRKSGVLLITDAGGSRPSFRKMAQRIAADGYVVLLPNLYYRKQPAPLFETMPSFSDPEVVKLFREIAGALTAERVFNDTAAYVDYLSGPLGVTGKIGTTGYCMGGAIAMRAAAIRPERVAAMASFHGGHLIKADADSPHLLLPKIQAQLYFGHAVNDSIFPAEHIAQLEAALKANGSHFESEVYQAGHGFAVTDNPNYDEAACQKHWDKLLGLFRAAL